MKRVPPFWMACNTAVEKYRWETFWTKEPETIAWIDSFKPNTVFYDVGANVGVYSLYAASLDKGLRIYAFEPHEANNSQLHYNRDYNRFGMQPDGFAKITILKYAVGDVGGQCCLEVPDMTVGTTGAQMRDGTWTAESASHPCERVAIDDFVKLWPLPDYVKVDVDGQEDAVVRGMLETLPMIDSILVEVSRETKEEVGLILLGAGFTTRNRFNTMTPHSRERREAEGIDAENIIFTRR